MEIIRTVKDMQEWSARHRAGGRRIGFVPTMGYLHEGHLSLVRYGRDVSDALVVSIFVNPKQFGPAEDLDQYPRDLNRDLDLLRPLGVDAVFNPPPEQIYGPNFQTRVEVTELALGLCGKYRPDFFPGVATVVLKLFNIITPDTAIFGSKDYQQLQVIKQLVKDVHLPVEVIGRPTVREKDGLAMSSRNAYLNPEERDRALSLYRGLELARELVQGGETSAAVVRDRMWEFIGGHDAVEVQYIEFVDPNTLRPVDRLDAPAILAMAVFVGKTRLIDNGLVAPPSGTAAGTKP
jgi:pantoate--beta-alanine ligase